MPNDNFCNFGKEVKKKLVDINQSQSWLAAKVEEDTGLKIDAPYISNILAGRRKPQKAIESICKILNIAQTSTMRPKENR